MREKNQMNTLNKAQVITQIISAAGLLCTLAIYYLQLRTMGKQLAAMQQGTAAQHILSLMSFIESDEIRAARVIVYTKLRRKPFSEWTESELLAASRVCSSFSTTGTVLKSGIVPIEPILEGLEQTIHGFYQILEPFIREMRKPENGGPQYGIGFDWLYNRIDGAGATGQSPQRLSRAHHGFDIWAKFKRRTVRRNHVG
ncbi:MAG: hypothetical protein JO360_14350 [Acidobacteria bacterium]|nr:hypothetical protein [Acidobacteriota bacterium]